MRRNPCDKVLASIAAEPRAILPKALEQIIAIASGFEGDIEAALAKREERGSTLAARRQERTAVIPVFGPIFPRASWYQQISGATSVSVMSAMLDDALADGEVDSILLDIDSPGGQVTGIHEFAARLRAAGGAKPVAAYVSGMAATAAYWLASATGRIVADRTATVGSIGTVFAWTDDSAARKSQGLRDYVVVSSQSPNKYLDPKSQEGLSELQRLADATAGIFIEDVAAYRGTTPEAVRDEYGQGGVVMAEDALTAGMIDGIGGMDAALEGFAPDAGAWGFAMRKGNSMSTLVALSAAVAPGGGKKPKANDEDDRKDEAEPEEDEEAKASEDGGEDEEEKPEEEEEAKSKKSVKNAKAANPEVFRTAYRAGVADERARIRAIRDLGIIGHRKLVESAMFDAPTTAEKLAISVVKAEQGALAAAGAARLRESAEMAVPAASVAPGERTGLAAEEAAVIRVMSGL